ncbi:hypothetical protein Cgig2_008923 [Carnegiea gigantea]|uniref:Dymeclin n=1 Tax=Carnegiea gigantea TaxID=171969 RepID=A0A9Q1GKC3_9CARY|nr:hypothetical protein Cgig2_008923 [Carnegiea gigantea]
MEVTGLCGAVFQNSGSYKLVFMALNCGQFQSKPFVADTQLSYLFIVSSLTLFGDFTLQDVYLHTNCLATLANMAPHVHRLDAYASERLSMELHIYTDFLRIVLEILNSILTYALPRNPEVVYAIMHRQEVFHPFRSHPRFTELLENIFIVLDFFNSRMDAQEVDGEWSVEKVFQVITNNCRAWRGEGMKVRWRTWMALGGEFLSSPMPHPTLGKNPCSNEDGDGDKIQYSSGALAGMGTW